jgi:hypothetical protein
VEGILNQISDIYICKRLIIIIGINIISVTYGRNYKFFPVIIILV